MFTLFALDYTNSSCGAVQIFNVYNCNWFEIMVEMLCLEDESFHKDLMGKIYSTKPELKLARCLQIPYVSGSYQVQSLTVELS